jgi:hypothetical protein
VRVWDARSGECLEMIQGCTEVLEVAAGSQRFPLRALACGLECAVERADSRKTIAWFPVCLEHVVTHTSGRTWAGVMDKYLCLFTLEGHDGPT